VKISLLRIEQAKDRELKIENPINFLQEKFFHIENQFDLERSLIKNLNVLEQIEEEKFSLLFLYPFK
jgi:hypothetical protein